MAPSFSISESTIDNLPTTKMQKRWHVEKRWSCADEDNCSGHRALIIGIICTIVGLKILLIILLWRRYSRKRTTRQYEQQRLYRMQVQKKWAGVEDAESRYPVISHGAVYQEQQPIYNNNNINNNGGADLPPPYEAAMPRRPDEVRTK